MSFNITWNDINNASSIVTLLGIPSIIGLYIGLRKELKQFIKINRKYYISKRLSGTCTFDYSNNNGLYCLGSDDLFFEVMFSKGSDTCIYIYNDPTSITGVALANDIYKISKIIDASKYDMSSRCRAIQKGEVAILKNIYGNYCAIKILDIKDRLRNNSTDEVTFEYLINDEGFTDFSE